MVQPGADYARSKHFEYSQRNYVKFRLMSGLTSSQNLLDFSHCGGDVAHISLVGHFSDSKQLIDFIIKSLFC